jgi:ribosomal protein S18 acetylase RimI-like enzyme
MSGSPPVRIAIEPLTPAVLGQTARVLAQAFVTNPMHAAALGPGALARNEAFFASGLAVMRGPKWIALDDGRIVGFVHWVASPGCHVSAVERLQLIPPMVRRFGLGSARKVGAWLAAWAKHDPAEAHVHLGPIGVLPDAQGRGVGQRLMERYCEELAEAGGVGYLETDRPGNVGFYRRFGFETIGEEIVLGVRNYFMRRERRT